MHLQQDDRSDLIEALPFWQSLAPADQERLLSRTALRTYPEGGVVKSAGDNCAGILLLRSGQLRAFFSSESGREITLFRLLPGELCVLSAPCAHPSISFEISVGSERESILYEIPPAIWSSLTEKYASAAAFSSERINARFSEVMWVLDQLISRNLGQRLSRFLLEQAALEKSDTLRITHEAIANHIGTAREVVSRALKYLEGEGALSLGRGTIRIKKRELLFM